MSRATASRSEAPPLVPGPVIAWRAWGLSGRDETLRLRPLGRYPGTWQPRRPVEASCGHWRLHRAPAIGCTCGVHGAREIVALQRARGPSVIGSVALWGTVVEHARGYRARFGYPMGLCLVCPICFWQLGPERSSAPVVVAGVPGGGRMPLCADHLGTAVAVGLSVRRLVSARDAFDTLLDAYGVEQLSMLDAT